jgi:hypothetical protein
VVKNATPRQGLAARTATALRRLGFKATNGGNAPTGPGPSSPTPRAPRPRPVSWPRR